MAFGFGFNKQKVLSAAEKFVQQGKLPNAISEYEKVLKADPKDLTVMNTVGDLHSRLGETDKAAECFKSVGDAYAAQGLDFLQGDVWGRGSVLGEPEGTDDHLADLESRGDREERFVRPDAGHELDGERQPMLCGEALAGLSASMKMIKFDVGKEFEVVTVSFNPKETTADADACRRTLASASMAASWP